MKDLLKKIELGLAQLDIIEHKQDRNVIKEAKAAMEQLNKRAAELFTIEWPKDTQLPGQDLPYTEWQKGDILRVTIDDCFNLFQKGDLVVHNDEKGDPFPWVDGYNTPGQDSMSCHDLVFVRRPE
jgi:hypothetical protein